MQPPRLSFRKKLIFVSFVVILALGIVEGVHRFVAWKRLARLERRWSPDNPAWLYVEHPQIKYVLKPGTWSLLTVTEAWPAALDLYGRDKLESLSIHINSYGLRGPEVSVPAEGGTFRILCLGGSTTFGTGVLDDSLSYPAQLEARLRERFPDQRIEVLNAGCSGYRTAESLMNLDRLRPLDPDMIIVCHAINDIDWGNAEAYYQNPRQNPRPMTRRERFRRAYESFFFQYLYDRWRGLYHSPEKGVGALLYPTAREGFANNLRRFSDMSREMGADAVFMTMVTRLDDPELTREEQEEIATFKRFDDPDTMRETLNQYNAITRAIAAERGALLVDPVGRISSDSSLWVDFCHKTEEGTALMVDVIEEALVDRLREKWTR